MNEAWWDIERDPVAASWMAGETDCSDVDGVGKLLALWNAVSEVQQTGRDLVVALQPLANQREAEPGEARRWRGLIAQCEDVAQEIQFDVAIMERVMLQFEIV